MTFLEKFEEIKKVADVDVTFKRDFAIQINLTDEDCHGAFYVEHRDGVLNVEPYDYNDRDAMMTISSDVLLKILTGKADPVATFLSGKFAIDGDVEAVLELKKIAEALKAEKKAAEKAEKEAKKAEEKAKKEAEKKAKAEAEAKKTEEKAKKEAEKKAPAKKAAEKAEVKVEVKEEKKAPVKKAAAKKATKKDDDKQMKLDI
ncbi:MAG: SCP2 sterol-binding domain-containing protein [Clostridia bacterium]|nr:SCP2 sterol-binding domain-containing protein [Clostridia bacterium]